MLTVVEWAAKYGVSRAALDELLMSTYMPPVASGLSGEMAVQQQIRAEAPALGGILGRNNRGAYLDDRGVEVRYGWLNDSKKVNNVLKTGDLLGITEVVDPISRIPYGVFTMPEIKAPGYGGPRTKHDQAQARAIMLVRKYHGIAGFASDVEHYRKMITDYRAGVRL